MKEFSVYLKWLLLMFLISHVMKASSFHRIPNDNDDDDDVDSVE